MSVGVALSALIMPAYRIAGISRLAMAVPSPEMYAEAIPELNRLFGVWNCDGHKIWNTKIATYALTSGQKTYTIGPGGDFDTDRPVFISDANVLFPTTPVVRRPVRVIPDEEWAAIRIQDIPGAPPYQLYYDGGMDATTGRGNIYLRFQPPAGYTLELFTWQGLKRTFTASTDVAVMPDGYEGAAVYNLAKCLAALNPEKANMSAAAYQMADRNLAALISLNSRCPRMGTEAGLTHDDGPGYGWLQGPFA